MNKHIQQLRDQILYDLWEKLKNRITMEELAEVFAISTKSTYRIIRQEKIKGRK